MDQDATWYEGRRRPSQHCVRWGPSSSLRGAQSPIFGPSLLWPNGWIDQDATWYGGRPRPRRHCVTSFTWGPSFPPEGVQPTNCRLMSIVAKRSPISATAEHLSCMHCSGIRGQPGLRGPAGGTGVNGLQGPTGGRRKRQAGCPGE